MCYVFIFVFEWGVEGLGWANLLSMMICYFVILVQTYLCKDLHEALFLPNRDSFTGLRSYLAIAIPSMIIVCLFMVCLETRLILAGHLGPHELAAMAVITNFCYFMQSWGVSVQ